MTSDGARGFRTRAVHAGESIARSARSVAPVIYQSSTYRLEDPSDYHDIKYLRLNNTPNHEHVGVKVAALEGTEAALPTASGMAAVVTALLSFVGAGEHVIAQRCLYGCTRDFLDAAKQRFGIEVDYVSVEDPDEWAARIRPSTRVFYVESVSNPLIEIGRLDEIARFARERALVSIIDNTFPSPFNFRPQRFGYDVIVHSATKSLNGHSDLVAGVVAGSREHVDRMRQQLNHLGAPLDPHASWLLARGMRTLPLRMAAQNASASRLASWLVGHGSVRTVRYPGLPSDPSHERASAWFDGPGSMLTFVAEGGLERAAKLVDALELAMNAPSLGGLETLVSRPSLTSHACLDRAAREAIGIDDAMVRVSVGIEDVADIIADFDQALRRSSA